MQDTDEVFKSILTPTVVCFHHWSSVMSEHVWCHCLVDQLREEHQHKEIIRDQLLVTCVNTKYLDTALQHLSRQYLFSSPAQVEIISQTQHLHFNNIFLYFLPSHCMKSDLPLMYSDDDVLSPG